MIHKFENPYKSVDEEFLVRLQSHIQKEDYEMIKLIRPNTGTVTTTVNMLWRKLIDALVAQGITDISSREQFEHFVANSQLVLPEVKVKGRKAA